MTTIISQIGYALAILALVESEARANCDDLPSQTSQADNTVSLVNRCGSVRQINSNGISADYNMDHDDWDGRGMLSAEQDNTNCPIDDEFSKILNAAMLNLVGVNFSRPATCPFPVPYIFLGTESFHASAFPHGDYANLVSANSGGGTCSPLFTSPVTFAFVGDNDWHNDFRHQVIDTLPGGAFAQYVPRTGIFIPDLIQGACRIYDQTAGNRFARLPSASASFRAESLVHEAWHAWENNRGLSINTSCGHTFCPGDGHPISASCGTGECDYWYPHPLDPIGSMGAVLHRPYQAQTEFACDIANTPQSWVFVIVMEQAAADADVYGTTDSINGVQPACYNFNFGQHFPTCPTSSAQCDQAVSCSGGKVCDPQTGCCTTPPACTVTGESSCDGACICDFTTGCCVPLEPPPK